MEMKQYAKHTNLTMRENPPSQHNILKEHLKLYFKKTDSSLLQKNNLQAHGTAMGTKMAVAFVDIFNLW